jgi:hypothetical protein
MDFLSKVEETADMAANVLVTTVATWGMMGVNKRKETAETKRQG